MKPRVKVAKGWDYRLILVDKDGHYVWDDYHYKEQIIVAAQLLLGDLEKERLHESKEHTD